MKPRSLLVALLFACGPTLESSPTVDPHPTQRAQTVESTERIAEPSTAETSQTDEQAERNAPIPAGLHLRIEIDAEFDDQAGDDHVVYEDGSLSVGDARAEVDWLEGRDPNGGRSWQDGVVLKERGELRVVELRRSPLLRAIWVHLAGDVEETWTTRDQLFVLRAGQLESIAAITHTGTSAQDVEVRFSGRGSLRYIESAMDTCRRLGEQTGAYPERAAAEEVTMALNEDGQLVEISRRRMPTRNSCEFAACPFVYIVDGDSSFFAGEILRNLRGPDDYALQSLALPTASARTLRLRIVEEKPETTYLDEVYVEVDGQHVFPQSCSTQHPPSYCVADHIPFVMQQGDAVELEFEVGTGEALLYGRGYYVP